MKLCILIVLASVWSSTYGNGLGLRRRTPLYAYASPLPADLETSPAPASTTSTLSPPENQSNSTATTVDVQPESTPDQNDQTDQPDQTDQTDQTDQNDQSTVSNDLVTNEPPLDVDETPSPNSQSKRPGRPQPTTSKPVNYDCKRKDDGYYPDPKDKCSSRFFACVGGVARQLDCSSGLVYEPDTGTCERRQDSFRCSGVRKTTVPTTPRRPPPPPSRIGIDCAKLDDGWYTDPKKKCSHTFYACTNGAGARFTCPANSYFDQKSISCKPYDDVYACSGKQPTTVKNAPSVTPLPKNQSPIDCENSLSGVYADPKNKCSRVYYACSNGDTYKQTCPADTYFDPKELLCDFYDDIFACSGKVKKPNNVTVAPLPTIASMSSKEFNCTGKPDGAHLPSSQKCSKTYYRCFNGFSYKLQCPAELYFDLDNDMCERYANVYACSGKRRTTLKPTTAKPIPAEKVPIDCKKLKDGDYEDPTKKCSSTYYSCSNAIGIRRECSRGTYFDKHTKTCESREYVHACNGGKPRPASLRPPTTRYPVTKSPYKCEKADGNFATGKCESRYYACVGGTAITSDCPSGTIYDKEHDECGYKQEIPACGGVRPTSPPSNSITSKRPPY